MITYLKQVYRGMPFKYEIKKDRYCDKTVYKSISENTVDNVALESYPGVGVCIRNGLAEISAGTLPNGTDYKGTTGICRLSGAEYLYKEAEYTNYTANGDITVNEKSGEVTGFGEETGLATPAAAPASDYFDAVLKVYFNGSGENSVLWAISETCQILLAENKLGVSDTSLTTGTTAFSAGTYWFRAIYDNTAGEGVFQLYYLADDAGSYTLDGLPALSSWGLELSKGGAANPFGGAAVKIGYCGTAYWRGNMYLSGAEISTADGVWWTPGVEVVKILPGIADAAQEDCEETAVWNVYYSYEDNSTALASAESFEGRIWIGAAEAAEDANGSLFKLNYSYGGSFSYDGFSVKGFLASSYIVSSYKVGEMSYFSADLDFICNVTTGGDDDARWFLFVTNGNGYGLGTTASNQWRIKGPGEDAAGGSFAYNTKYWVRLVQSAGSVSSTYAFYYMADDGSYTLETLPGTDSAAWLSAGSGTGMFFNNTQLALGCDYEGKAAANAWSGAIDLSKTVLKSKMPSAFEWVTAISICSNALLGQQKSRL